MLSTAETPRALAQSLGLTPIEGGHFAWLLVAAMLFALILAGFAAARRISWAWCIGAVLGLALVLGTFQSVAWARGCLP